MMKDLPRPDGDRGQAGAVCLVRGGRVHEGDDAPVHVLLRIEQGLRRQPEGAGRSLIHRVRDRFDARHLGALELRRGRGGEQLQHVLAGRGLIQRTQRQGARTLVDADPLVLRPVALERRVLSEQYVLAARTSGVSTWGILTRHVLPNIWPTLATNLAVTMGGAVLAEAGLSYLGLGAPPPNASWGRLLQDAQATFTTQPLGAIAPGLAIVAFVLGANLAADGLRSLIDPTQGGAK